MNTPKKSESIEIRIPHATKEAFMARCRDEGRSASEAVRAFIDAELQPRPHPASVPPKRLRLIVGGAIAAIVGAAALPSLAHTGLAAPVRGFMLRSDFDRLDANHDGMVSFEEYRRVSGR